VNLVLTNNNQIGGKVMTTKSLFDLSGRVAVVTGASSGLGVQMAKALALHGADIAVLARRKEKLDQVSEEIKSMGVKCIAVKCDVTDTESVKAAVNEVVSELGTVDIVVNNAGTGGTGPTEETTDENLEHTLSVDVSGVFKVAREFGKVMLEKKYGRIINIASIYGMVGNMALPSAAYHTAKGAVVNFTRALASEWGQHNITVNSICPGYFETELTGDTLNTETFTQYMQAHVPVGRYGKTGELDSTVVYLSSDASAYVNGVILPVDGGYTAI
jgi:NAD(P)-dependent dehydrogenase (short-subunit alcohol dehydrogenase family)